MASPKISPKMQKRIPIVSSLCPSIPRKVTCERSGNFKLASPAGFSWAEAAAALSKVSRALSAPAFANRLLSEPMLASQVLISDPPSKSCHQGKQTAEKGPHSFCHSERSEESLFLFMGLNPREIPRFARNDKINYFFRGLFSLLVYGLQSHEKDDGLKSDQLGVRHTYGTPGTLFSPGASNRHKIQGHVFAGKARRTFFAGWRWRQDGAHDADPAVALPRAGRKSEAN